jgi:putative transposase
MSAQLNMFALPSRPRHPGGRPVSPHSLARHMKRRAVCHHHPHHITLRMRKHVWNLRSQRCFSRIAHALKGVQPRVGFRIVHFAVLGNHVHLLVEAEDRSVMTNGVRALAIRIAKRLNKMMHRRGSLYVDRYHERILTSPTTVRNALRYVLTNAAHHYGASASKFDRFSSAAPACRGLVQCAASWLLRVGWTRAP